MLILDSLSVPGLKGGAAESAESAETARNGLMRRESVIRNEPGFIATERTEFAEHTESR